MKINCDQTSNNLFVELFSSQFSTNLTKILKDICKRKREDVENFWIAAETESNPEC